MNDERRQKPAATDVSVCTAMRRATRRLSQLFDEALAPLELKTTQYAILHELAADGEKPPSVQELATSLVLDRGGLRHALRPLERDGLVATLEDPKDRRRGIVVLTARGKALERKARGYVREAERRFEQLFGADERDALVEKLAIVAFEPRYGSLRD